jgi:hypothetical protein
MGNSAVDHVSRVREGAHAIWEQEGGPEGEHERHWTKAQAEQQLQAGGHKGGDPDTPADTPDRPGLGPMSDQGTNREPPPNEPPSWTDEGEPKPTTDEPGLD